MDKVTNDEIIKKDEKAATSDILSDLEIYTPYIDASVAKHKKAKKIRKIVLISVI
jgi:hypothetical protein